MQLAPASSSPTSPVYAGLRVSTDREFSAPMFADNVRPMQAEGLITAVKEARDLLAAGAFDGPRDAAKAVVLLSDDESGSSFRAGSLVEMDRGSSHAVGMPVDGPHFEYWFEPGVAAIVDADGIRLAH